MGSRIGLIIILVVALGLGLYLYSSGAFATGLSGFNSVLHGPSGSLFGASSSTKPTATSTSSSSSTGWSSFWSFLGFSGLHAPAGPAAPHQQAPPPLGGTTTPSGATSTINPADIPAGFTAAQLSPYFHEVRFGTVSAGTSYYYGTITLSTYFNTNATGTIDVTGWQIKSKGSGEYIPQAINRYDPSGLAAPSDIRLKNGDTAYLYSTSAPFNVRLNECIGYVAHVANFKPALPLTCPYVDRSQIENFTGECQNYILSIGQCQAPNMSSPQIPRTDYACQNYLNNNFTYTSCFQAHDTDANFLSNQVWVWTGSNVVDPYHDVVELLDRNGLLVDLRSY